MKKKVSPFEFAIMQIADPEEAKKHKPYTSEEVEKMREDKLRNMASRFKVKNP